MKVKKKYYLIAFCVVALLVFGNIGLGFISRKDKETDRERMYELYMQLVNERPDTFAIEHVVEPAFINKYDHLTETNFNAFVKDWKEWSMKLQSFSSDTHVNEAIGRTISIYSKENHADTCTFYSLPSNIIVSKYPCNLKDYSKEYTINSEQITKKAEHYAYYIPDFETDKEVVYISPEIERILSLYVGGVSESESYEDERSFTPINEERLSELRQIIPAAYGHWGGYWHFESMPIIFGIFMFQDGFITNLRKSWCEGDLIFVPYDVNKDPVVFCEWME